MLPYLAVTNSVYKIQLSWLAQLLLPAQLTAITVKAFSMQTCSCIAATDWALSESMLMLHYLQQVYVIWQSLHA